MTSADEHADKAVIGVGPAFDKYQHHALIDMPRDATFKELTAEVEEEGLHTRVVHTLCTPDTSFTVWDVTSLSGLGVGIGIQLRGTTVIHQRDLLSPGNLELFSQVPLLTLEARRQIGKGAARYTHEGSPSSMPVVSDQMVWPKFTAKAALSYIKGTRHMVRGAELVTLYVDLVREQP